MLCYAAYDVRSIDELSGRTTGRLGYIRPDTAYAIGGKEDGTMILYHLRIHHRTQALRSDDYGPAGAAGAWAMPQHPQGP